MLHWPYFWIVFLISAGVSGVVRKVYQLTPEEERLYQKLSGSQKRERMKRLEQAAERRKDLGL